MTVFLSHTPVAETRNQVLERLFRAHYHWLRCSLQRRTSDKFGSEDVAAETFAQVVALADPAAIHEPRALLTTISKRLLYRRWRRRDLEKTCMEALSLRAHFAGPSAEEQALLIEAVTLIDEALNALSYDEKRIFLLYKVDQLGYEEIGTLLGYSPSQVRRKIAKGLRYCLAAVAF